MTRETLIVLLILTCPWAVVVLVALARGYDLTVLFRRRPKD